MLRVCHKHMLLLDVAIAWLRVCAVGVDLRLPMHGDGNVSVPVLLGFIDAHLPVAT